MKFKMFIYFFLFILFSCKDHLSDNSKNILPDPPAPDLLISINIDVLNSNDKLNIILDTIINSEIKCKYFNKINSAFRISASKNDSEYNITISSINLTDYDFNKSIGYFKYKCSTFIWEGIIIPSLISYSGFKEIIRYAEPLEKTYDNDDRFSDWYFIFRNDSLVLNGHHNCY